MRRARRLVPWLSRWHKGSSVPGLDALQFLERSRDMVEEPVTAAPRPAESWVSQPARKCADMADVEQSRA